MMTLCNKSNIKPSNVVLHSNTLCVRRIREQRVVLLEGSLLVSDALTNDEYLSLYIGRRLNCSESSKLYK